ncbi:hypothetical protein VNO80_07970 [Phaseolus coccineus]|uniref:Uncharacterized protein n=1 Tax=Phaseolus coccineus TaxID=3886 RepID=A0AAN9RFT7_PHACN
MSHDRSRHPRKSSADLATYRERDRERERRGLDIGYWIVLFLEERKNRIEGARGGSNKATVFPPLPMLLFMGFSPFSL